MNFNITHCEKLDSSTDELSEYALQVEADGQVYDLDVSVDHEHENYVSFEAPEGLIDLDDEGKHEGWQEDELFNSVVKAING